MQRSVTRICVAICFTLLTSCCVSYHAVAKIDRNDVNRSIGASSVITVVEGAIKSVGQTDAAKRSADGMETLYTVRRGTEIVDVGINEQKFAIYMGWDWRSHSDLPAQLQSAITRDFSVKFNSQLRFEDAPCGIFGP